MKNHGFTLIEMLATVLIVGILAAVALPQYQKAILKSRFVALMPGLSALRDGEESFYLANRHYTMNMRELDVKVPQGARIVPTGACAYLVAQPEGVNARLVMYLDHGKRYPGQTHCEAYRNDEQAKWLCQSLNGQYVGAGASVKYNAYVLDGDSSVPPAARKTCLDTNGDGETNIADVTHWINIRLGQLPEGTTWEDWDLNGDGCVDNSDATCMITFLLYGSYGPGDDCELAETTQEDCESGGGHWVYD